MVLDNYNLNRDTHPNCYEPVTKRDTCNPEAINYLVLVVCNDVNCQIILINWKTFNHAGRDTKMVTYVPSHTSTALRLRRVTVLTNGHSWKCNNAKKQRNIKNNNESMSILLIATAICYITSRSLKFVVFFLSSISHVGYTCNFMGLFTHPMHHLWSWQMH